MPTRPENVRFEAQHAAMGTIYSIAAYAPPSISLENVVGQVFNEIDRLDALMSHYRPPSEICAINRDAFQAPVTVSTELFALLEQAFGLSEATDGAFDVTVGTLMKAWGFFRRSGRIPTHDELAQALQRTGFRRVRLDPLTRSIRFASSGIELDLGADGSRQFLVRNPGLTALLFQPAGGRTVEQIVLTSTDATLPEGSFLRLEEE